MRSNGDRNRRRGVHKVRPGPVDGRPVPTFLVVYVSRDVALVAQELLAREPNDHECVMSDPSRLCSCSICSLDVRVGDSRLSRYPLPSLPCDELRLSPVEGNTLTIVVQGSTLHLLLMPRR